MKGRTISLITLADWFSLHWHPSSLLGVLSLCVGRTAGHPYACLKLYMCIYNTAHPPPLTLQSSTSGHTHKKLHKFYSVLTETWSSSSNAMPKCILRCRGIFFSLAGLMFNTCAAPAKILVRFNGFWMV